MVSVVKLDGKLDVTLVEKKSEVDSAQTLRGDGHALHKLKKKNKPA